MSNRKDNMSSLEPRNHTKVDPEYYNTADVHDNDLKIAFMNMPEILKEKMKKKNPLEKSIKTQTMGE